ncbi:hypothetical protein FZI91_21785 [Mycobacterium sp. CBMA271]|uniref:hypothetical protein n=1 Tax=unclassified Mycobacteroides TaxID=2618759 RepID=UPI0012DE40E0|nr:MULTISPECIES: hypothetical protein [unclassified Mycobacteroides]MUM19711.1 hypothetical protein [Mycobacteroides sp. CBMA 326]MUM24315.1 hypothetical protein [Mycobacteroides sp. CBMA 271]
MTTPDKPDTPTQPVPAPAPAPRSASNTLLVKIAAVVGIVAGAFVILGVTFGLGVLAGSQCGGHGGHHHDRGRTMMFERGGMPPGPGVIIQRGPEIGPPDGGPRQERRPEVTVPLPPNVTVPRP